MKQIELIDALYNMIEELDNRVSKLESILDDIENGDNRIEPGVLVELDGDLIGEIKKLIKRRKYMIYDDFKNSSKNEWIEQSK